MALTYEWKVFGLKKVSTELASDVIIGVSWTVTGTDEDGNSGTFDGTTPFKPQDVDLANFVPYAELDHDTVIGWVQAEVVGDYKYHVDQEIQRQIDSAKSLIVDVHSSQFPWVQAE